MIKTKQAIFIFALSIFTLSLITSCTAPKKALQGTAPKAQNMKEEEMAPSGSEPVPGAEILIEQENKEEPNDYYPE